MHSTYSHDYPNHCAPRPKLYRHVHAARRVPSIDPRATQSKNWISDCRSNIGAFDKEVGLRCRARSAPSLPRWAPRKLLPDNWTTNKWNSTYKVGSGAARRYTAASQEQLAQCLEESIVREECAFENVKDQATPNSEYSTIGSWDLRQGKATKRHYDRIRGRDRNLSETWFSHPDNPTPSAESTYMEMTDPSQVDRSIFDADMRELSNPEQRKIAHIQWLMEHEKSKHNYKKNRNRGKSMTESWHGEYWPRLRPPTPPKIPHSLQSTRPFTSNPGMCTETRKKPPTRAVPRTTLNERPRSMANASTAVSALRADCPRSMTKKQVLQRATSASVKEEESIIIPTVSPSRIQQHHVEDIPGSPVQRIPLAVVAPSLPSLREQVHVASQCGLEEYSLPRRDPRELYVND